MRKGTVLLIVWGCLSGAVILTGVTWYVWAKNNTTIPMHYSAAGQPAILLTIDAATQRAITTMDVGVGSANLWILVAIPYFVVLYRNLTFHAGTVTPQERQTLLNQKGHVV